MKKALFIALLCCLGTTYAQQSGTVKGQVTTADNEPIPYASVFINKIQKGVSADEQGYFSIYNVPYGNWILQASAVGFVSASTTISVDRQELSGVTFSLDLDNHLNAVEVFGNRYQHPDKIEALTRLPLEPYEQIQSISVIGEKLIEDQGALTISEATKNVPGVYTFATYGNKRESMSSRGFRGIPILKNGVRVHSDFRGVGILTDMQGVDNIQVLKGAASITQGVATDLGSPGGIINIVTKTPKYRFGGQASLRVGSYGQVRPTFDVYGPLNEKKNVAFRINGALERADSYRRGISSERFYINPSLQWRIDDKTKVTLEMDYFDDSRTPDMGTVNLNENDVNAIYDLPHNQFLGFKNDKSITKNSSYSIRFDRALSDKLTLKGAFYKSHLDLNDKGAGFGRGSIEAGGETQYNLRQRSYSTSTRKDDNSVLQFDLIGDDIYTGSIKHTFQVGFDYRASKYATRSQSSGTIDTIDVFAQNTNRLPGGLELGEASTNGGETKSIGFVAQDVITWTDWFKTFIGLRYSSTETIAEVENTTSEAFNPLAGVIFSPIKNINIFASYTNSSYPRTAARLGKNGEELGNERYDQLEAGVKTTWLDDRLRFNLTLFKINNKDINLAVYDETWTNILYYEKGGNDQRQGIEAELTGRPLENLEVIAGYSYIDARYKEHNAYVYGSAPLNTPKHTANLYANYLFKGNLEGLSVGAGAYYTGKRPINDWSSGAVTHEGIVPNQKPFDVKEYTLVNFQAGYKIDDNWGVRFLVNNLFNEIGYNAYRTSFINQTDPRTFAGVVTYTF
ncbi:TonB-dependent receptor [Sinomicrobium weinanense]|uniref:TonB-dependent receptor n=1 Tax=Sinomicrobium weinanense TaxID=2842200 RepID=A0A926JQG1_9FLAO|nr:TonB-dependent receptor [Sinomicrobium weinanense]MBC9795481.1 TonB-dependent receptor [Sinomicrobium weinanense]MBU3123372.1 TonB-dependent receptor [Sinomicrobium weinanense]